MGQNRRREPRHDLTPTSGNTASVSFNQRASRKKNPDAEPSSKKVAGLEPAQSHAHHSLSLRVKYIFLVAPLFSACTLAFTTWIKLVLFPAGKIRIHTELLLWSRALLAFVYFDRSSHLFLFLGVPSPNRTSLLVKNCCNTLMNMEYLGIL